jgi:transposase-like protein
MAVVERSAFAGFRFPPEVITVAVRWYLRYGLSYRDVEELLGERGIEADHVTVYRWVQRFAPLFAEAARPCRHATGDRWFVDESYLKVAGRWRYLYRAVDQFGQVIDVLLSEQRDTAARRFFTRALRQAPAPVEVTTDRAPAYLNVLAELLPAAPPITERYENNNPIEADHGRLKAQLRPMRGLKRLRCAAIIAAGHAFVQNLRRGSYELGLDRSPRLRLATAFTSSPRRSDRGAGPGTKHFRTSATQQRLAAAGRAVRQAVLRRLAYRPGRPAGRPMLSASAARAL